jgi:hypothetical protein
MAKFYLSRLMEKDQLRPQSRQEGLRVVPVTDDDIALCASSPLPSLGGRYSPLDQRRCNKGLDMIESLFTTIFGGCCRPDSCPDVTESTKIMYQDAGRTTNCNGTTPVRHCDPPLAIPQPPEIRRLALDDEDLSTMSDVDPSGALGFLFYQG